jgi:ribonucleoside-diphosphate reductase alpha chain
MNCFAIAVSIGLQYGVPLDEYYDKFTFSRFEPSGMVEGHANIKSSTSVVDFIFRLLGFEYLNRQEQLHIKPKVSDEITPVDTAYNLAQNEIQPKMVKEVVESKATAPKAMKKSGNAPSMGDAPACKSCGNITVRSGTCYTCLTCGTTSGCS